MSIFRHILLSSLVLAALGCAQENNSTTSQTANEKAKPAQVTPAGQPYQKVINYADYTKYATYDAERTLIYVYGATWCGACIATKPQIKAIAAESTGFDDYSVVYIDIDLHPERMEQDGIKSVPAVRIFDQKKLVEKIDTPAQMGTIRTIISKIRSLKKQTNR
jgi:thioredoxin-like negative regulator of GroEL